MINYSIGLEKGGNMLIGLLVLSVIIIALLTLFYVRECNRCKYFKDLLIKILNNNDIVQESIATVAAAYDIEEGDLLNYISNRSKK